MLFSTGETVGNLGTACEAGTEPWQFKHTNDNRLQTLEQRGAVDPLISDKLDRIDAALDGYKQAMDRKAVDLARPALDGRGATQPDEYKAAFSAYVRRGEEKALSVGSNPDGGYLVPDETATEITRLLTGLSPIRSIAGRPKARVLPEPVLALPH